MPASPGARAHYDRRRHAGDHHAAAQRNLFNRGIGCLHHCLATGQTYQETIAFPNPQTHRALQLDTFTAWDVYITRKLYRTLTASMTPTTNNPVLA